MCEGDSGSLYFPLGRLMPSEAELEERVNKLLKGPCRVVRLVVEVHVEHVLKEWIA